MINIKRILPVVYKQAGRKGHQLAVVGRTKSGRDLVLKIHDQRDTHFGFRNEIGTVECKLCGMKGRVTDIPGHEWPEGELFNKRCKRMHRLDLEES